MQMGPKIAEVASLIGDPARANMVSALMDGRALTASELAFCAHITPQTASGHLAKLVDGGLLAPAKQGRHRYFRLASPLVGQMLEGIMGVAQAGPARYQPHWRGGEDLRFARLCYDHLAGELAVRMTQVLADRAHVLLSDDGGEVTPEGAAFLNRFGVDVGALRTSRRMFCRPCLDWSMRKPHIGGAVGAALARRVLDAGWVRRTRDSRALQVTPEGGRQLRAWFGIVREG